MIKNKYCTQEENKLMIYIEHSLPQTHSSHLFHHILNTTHTTHLLQHIGINQLAHISQHCLCVSIIHHGIILPGRMAGDGVAVGILPIIAWAGVILPGTVTVTGTVTIMLIPTDGVIPIPIGTVMAATGMRIPTTTDTDKEGRPEVVRHTKPKVAEEVLRQPCKQHHLR